MIRVLCKLRSLGLQGVTGYEVTAECDLSGGLPAFDIVGLPDAAVKEARERVRAAVKNCGFTFPVSRITVNLAPAAGEKAGTLYDLPILVGHPAQPAGSSDATGPACGLCGGALPVRGAAAGAWACCPWPWPAGRAGIGALYVPAENCRRGHPGRGAGRLPGGARLRNWSATCAGRSPSPLPGPGRRRRRPAAAPTLPT